MPRPLLLWLVLTTLLSSCVARSKYAALEAELDQTRSSSAETERALRERIEGLNADLEAARAALAEADRKLQEKDTQLESAREAIAALNAEKAALIKDRSQLRSSVQEMERALKEMRTRQANAEARVKQFQNLLSRFQPLIDAGRLKVKIVDGRMVVSLPTDILFASGSARISAQGRDALTEVAQVLADMSDRRFQIEGHTDNVPIHTPKYPSNWQLAADRAIQVLLTLEEAGVPVEHLSAASFADTRPVASNETQEGRAANRRIEIVVVPDLSTLPGYSELLEVVKEGAE